MLALPEKKKEKRKKDVTADAGGQTVCSYGLYSYGLCSYGL